MGETFLFHNVNKFCNLVFLTLSGHHLDNSIGYQIYFGEHIHRSIECKFNCSCIMKYQLNMHVIYCQLRARWALMLFKYVSLRTRRALLLYKVYSDSAISQYQCQISKY